MKTRNLLMTAAAMSCLLLSSSALADHDDDDRYSSGTIYVMENSPDGNNILIFRRQPNGKLQPQRRSVATGGLGGGDNAPVDPLGSQHSLVYDADLDMLFAVNAGDNTITAFDVDNRNGRPRRTDIDDSGGFIPVSIAVSDDLVYVLNAGGSGSVTTFHVDNSGRLEQLSSFDLGLDHETGIPFNNVMAPGQVGIDALQRRLVVVHGGGGEVLVAALDAEGIPEGEISSTLAPGIVPFAFAVTRFGTILVTEAGSSSVSAFEPPAFGTNLLTLSVGALGNGQAASCWIIASPDGYAYVSNTASDTLSLYRFDRTGDLSLIDAIAGTTSGAPTDTTFAANGRFLYSLDAADGIISGFRIDADSGALSLVETQSGLPAAAGLQGIAARD